MKFTILCVRDRVSNVYGMPMFVVSIGSGIRSFSDEVNRVDANNVMNKHPGDFDLYFLGTYDDSNGEFVCDDQPRQVAIGKECLLTVN